MREPPPIGLMPREIHEDKVRIERISRILDAMERYALAAFPIFPKWVQELRDLLCFPPDESGDPTATERTSRPEPSVDASIQTPNNPKDAA
jgi:hypothetical protein